MENKRKRFRRQPETTEVFYLFTTDQFPYSDWQKTTKQLKEFVEKIIGTKKHKSKQKWMAAEILELMDKRRKYRNINHEECCEIESLQNLHDEFSVHKQLKETAGVYKNSSAFILMNNSGKIATNPEIKIAIWENYIHELFTDNSRPSTNVVTCSELTGPSITRSEIMKAIKASKNNKAVGPDNLPVEVIKLIDEDNISLLENLFNTIYNTGVYPNDWLKSTFIALPKSSAAKKCKDFRLISLMNHILKIFLKVIHDRIYKKCESAMGRSQFGFKDAMGTREALFCIQVLVQNCRDVNKDVFMCFVDYEKAFDRVQHSTLMEILCKLNIDGKDMRCIENLYWNQVAEVRANNIVTNDIAINRGVRQGCILSPLLFNIYSAFIFQEAIGDIQKGIKVNGQYINNIRYADDTTLLSDNLDDLQCLINMVNQKSNSYGLSINIEKTKFMIVSRTQNPYLNTALKIDDQPIERVNCFKYLGCWLNHTWSPDKEIRCRIEIARNAFLKYTKVLTNRELNIKLRMRYMKCYVWSVLLYGVEVWTLKTAMMNKIEAFEMWCYRRMLKISWTDRVTNVEVLRRCRKERELLQNVKRRKTAYLGHLIRGAKYELPQLIIEGKIEGKRGIGRKQMSWLRNIREWTGLRTIGELIHTAQDREAYSSFIGNII